MEHQIKNNKIKDFIEWYEQEAMGYSTTEIGQYFPGIDMESLINKIAVWYDLKYSDDLIDSRENPNISIFTNEQLLSSLPWYERFFFLKTRYINMVKISNGQSIYNLPLDDDGYITAPPHHYIPEFLNGLHLKEALETIKDPDLGIIDINVEKAIKNYEIQERIKKELFDSITYCIISKGKNGLRRAFLFVKEFNLDPHIIMEYATIANDPHLIKEIEEYLEMHNQKKLEKQNTKQD